MGWREMMHGLLGGGPSGDEPARSVSPAQLERATQQVREKAARLEAEVSRDIIRALRLRYFEDNGFRAAPFEIRNSVWNADLILITEGRTDAVVHPQVYELGETTIEAFDFLLTTWATIVAMKVRNATPDFQVPSGWTHRDSGLLTLADVTNGLTYRPIATDMAGDVLPGIPKAGLVAFEPLRAETSDLELHLSGAPFTPEGFEVDLVFRLESPTLEARAAEAVHGESLTQRIEEALHDRHGEQPPDEPELSA